MISKIPIIIPVYNVEQYIEECLMSFTNQTMTEGIECIIVDDCGQDNSATIAKHFVDSYQGDIRFTFIQREKNGGSLPHVTLASRLPLANMSISSTATTVLFLLLLRH